MSLSGGGPEGFGLLSLAFPSNIMTLQNTTDNTNEKKQVHLYPSLGVGLSHLLINSVCPPRKGHPIVNRGGKANRGHCCQPGRQLCFSSSFQEWVPKAPAGFPLRAQRISMFYLDSHFRNPLGARCTPSSPDA